MEIGLHESRGTFQWIWAAMVPLLLCRAFVQRDKRGDHEDPLSAPPLCGAGPSQQPAAGPGYLRQDSNPPTSPTSGSHIPINSSFFSVPLAPLFLISIFFFFFDNHSIPPFSTVCQQFSPFLSTIRRASPSATRPYLLHPSSTHIRYVYRWRIRNSRRRRRIWAQLEVAEHSDRC